MLEGVNMTKSKKSLAIFYDQNVFFFESLKNLEEQERRDRIFDFLQENNQVVKQLGEIFHGMNKREAINKIFPFLDIESALEKLYETSNTKYIIANYTALQPTRTALKRFNNQ